MKGIFLISLVASLICAEELQLHKLNVAPNTPLSAQNTESKEGDSQLERILLLMRDIQSLSLKQVRQI